MRFSICRRYAGSLAILSPPDNCFGKIESTQFNSQHQPMIEWDPSFNAAGAYFNQAVRSGSWPARLIDLAESLR